MKKILQLTTICLVIITFASCAQKFTFPVSPIVPSAEAEVKVKKDNNENYDIDLNVKHLNKPDRLSPPKAMYVVWMETSTGTRNLGQLKSSSSLLSSTYKANLKTVSSQKPLRFLITAEDNADNKEPGSQVILETRVNVK